MLPGAAPAGEQVDLVGDAGAGRVDQVDHRHARSAYARSMIRMIFSTVRAPHEPALTVESLAIRQTGRPSTVAVPVITPSAGSPSASALA